MGCDTYTILGFESEAYIHFSEGGDVYPCLCTFPINYQDEKLDGETVMSLAMLGAAVCLAHQGKLNDWQYIPDCLPEWIVNEIKTHIIT